MIYVYRPALSSGAKELAAALEGRRLRRIEGGYGIRLVNGREKRVSLRDGDVVIGWGAGVPAFNARIRTLNGVPIQNKYDDALVLKRAGVPTIEVSKTLPRTQAATDPAVSLHTSLREALEEFSSAELSRNTVYIRGLNDLQTNIQRLSQVLQQPVPQQRATGEWIARIYNHVGGNDLLHPPDRPNYYVKKENIVKEFRVHSFLGKSIRAGVKAPREDVLHPHEWVRSYDGGWTIRYDGISSKQKHRELAHAAVAALGLQFGAVDIAQKADKSLIVLEVNRAPGLDGGTPEAYATAVRRWIAGDWQ